MRPIHFILTALFLLTQLQGNASETQAVTDPVWEDFVFSIEDSRAFVGVAPIYLKVSKLKPEDGNLVGTYKIEVPLMSSKNDHGKIVLPLNVSVSELGAKGGVLRGKAISFKEDTTANRIVCEIFPDKDQLIKLAITTDDRTVNFKSRYSLTESSGKTRDS